MASYRPISQETAWRSSASHDLTIQERYGEFYFLTSPSTNSIGCYRLVLRLAAAETGFQELELHNLISRLIDHEVLAYEDGYVLVRNWFRHNKWEATLTGNIGKAAKREIEALPLNMRSMWVTSSLQAGVPAEAIRAVLPMPMANGLVSINEEGAEGLESLLEGASKGLPSPLEEVLPQQLNKTELNKTITTTTTEHSKDGDGSAFSRIQIPSSLESDSAVLQKLLEGLDTQLAQDIVDELVGAQESYSLGKRKDRVTNVPLWVRNLVARAESGQFFLQAGKAVQDRRARLQADSCKDGANLPLKTTDLFVAQAEIAKSKQLLSGGKA
ncbi:hypothetical protein D3C72_151340 [compost metagenome]